MATHRPLFITRTLVAGSNQFTHEIPTIGFIPKGWHVRAIAYGGINGQDNDAPYQLFCRRLGGPLGFFFSDNTQNFHMTPNMFITNPDGQSIDGPTDFYITQNGVAVTNLTGQLTLLLELVSPTPRRSN